MELATYFADREPSPPAPSTKSPAPPAAAPAPGRRARREEHVVKLKLALGSKRQALLLGSLALVLVLAVVRWRPGSRRRAARVERRGFQRATAPRGGAAAAEDEPAPAAPRGGRRASTKK